jgi:FkbM family methyltransferase
MVATSNTPRDAGQVRHHPLVTAYDPVGGECSPGFDYDFLGVRTRRGYYAGMPEETARTARFTSYPPFDEEYFEWLDILQAVEEAADSFVMIELGAGYGRWCARAAAAIRRKPNCQFQLVAVEAEPAHFRWLREHFRDNDLDPTEHDLVWAAVGAQPGFVPFWVGAPDEWYGQAIAVGHGQPPPLPDVGTRRRLKARSALGRPPSASETNRSITWIPCVTLADVLSPYPRVDLIDLDVQGAEYDVLASAIDLLNKRVRRLHIGTHSTEIEQQLRQLLTAHRWEKLNDYPSQSTSETPCGPIQFGDGVQTWVNPAVPGAIPRAVETPKRKTPASDDHRKSLRRLRSRVNSLKEQNRTMKERNAELRERCRTAEETVRAIRASRPWPLRLFERWAGRPRRTR